ncbi:MAG TPA: family 16 glycoside hydrolase, partial [Isosphaeraceae bacterium]|nr:family 16 glycoside hydrolase [Isosphaeraceae bacterium]
MKRSFAISLTSVLLLGLSAANVIRADDNFRPLFNGKDLSGWVPVNIAPETFTVRDGMIVSTGKPTGVMRTDQQYENFV